MNLDEYRRSKRLTHKELSKILGLSRPALTNYLKGRRMPNSIAVDLIQKNTKGKVTFDDLYLYYKKLNSSL